MRQAFADLWAAVKATDPRVYIFACGAGLIVLVVALDASGLL